jgi:hypothetical protein
MPRYDFLCHSCQKLFLETLTLTGLRRDRNHLSLLSRSYIYPGLPSVIWPRGRLSRNRMRSSSQKLSDPKSSDEQHPH